MLKCLSKFRNKATVMWPHRTALTPSGTDTDQASGLFPFVTSAGQAGQSIAYFLKQKRSNQKKSKTEFTHSGKVCPWDQTRRKAALS